jgi:hypothetical protein
MHAYNNIYVHCRAENGFQRFVVRVYYWKTVEKQETDPQIFWKRQYRNLSINLQSSNMHAYIRIHVHHKHGKLRQCVWLFLFLYFFFFYGSWSRNSGTFHVCVCMYVCICACVCLCMYACMCVCVYVCMYVCIMDACMYVCMYVPSHDCEASPRSSSQRCMFYEVAHIHTRKEYVYIYTHAHTQYTHTHILITQMSANQARAAARNGARFITSPTNPKGFIEACHSQGVLAVPGVMTPTELNAASKCV